MRLNDVRVLFLAYYAPMNDEEQIEEGIRDKVYAEYHHRIFEVLDYMFPNLISINDPSYLLQKELPFDYIFSLFNRMPFRNSEVFVSSVAEYHKIPYLGARPNIRSLAEDKHLAKMMALYAGVHTPQWKIYNVGDKWIEPPFSPPYFVKPRFGAASLGIDGNSICNTWEAAAIKIEELYNLNLDVILEEQIIGIYHTSPVLYNFGDPILLPCIKQESTHSGGIVTYEQKRKLESGLIRSVVNDTQLQLQLQRSSLKMFELIQPLDYTRFDYIVDSNSKIPYFLEFNVCCNLGEHSTINQAVKHIGLSYEDLIANITFSSMFRNGLINETFSKKF